MNIKVATQVKHIIIDNGCVVKIRVILDWDGETKFGHTFVSCLEFEHNQTHALETAMFSIWANFNCRFGKTDERGDVISFVNRDEFIRAAICAYGRFPEDSDTPSEDSWVAVGSRITDGDKQFIEDLCAELRADGHAVTAIYTAAKTAEMAIVKFGIETAYHVFLFEDTKLAPVVSVFDLEKMAVETLTARGADTKKLNGVYLISPDEHKLGKKLAHMIHLVEKKSEK